METRKLIFLFAGVLLLPVLLLACGGDDDVTGTPAGETATQPSGADDVREVTVLLTNWAVEPSETTVQAGAVRFIAKHEEPHGAHAEDEAGKIHQLVVAPLDEGAKVGESKFGLPLVNLADIKLGEEKTAEVELEAGRYELSCLVVEEIGGKATNHYGEGMFALLEVE